MIPGGTPSPPSSLAIAVVTAIEVSELADISGLTGQRRSVGHLIRVLSDAGVLDRDEASVIADLLPLLNKAVHSEEYSREAAGWALQVGPELLAGLDRKIGERKQGS
jgi:hypothetical protein